MQKHLGRTLFIVALIVIAAINLFPTIGWYGLDEAEQKRRIDQWRSEELELRRDGAGMFARAMHGVQKWSQFNSDMAINLGLDLKGGVLMVIGFDFNEEMEARGMTEADVQQLVLQRVTNRISEFEATEPLIQSLGTNQVQIQLPGQKDIQRARDLITRTAHLGFHLVSGPEETREVLKAVDAFSNNGFIPFLTAPGPKSGSLVEVEVANFDLVEKVVKDATAAGVIPANLMIAFGPVPKEWQNTTRREVYVMEREEQMSGEGIKSASPQTDTRSPGNWMIQFEFDGDATNAFAALTESNIGRQMAIVLDDNVVSAPNINSRIFGSGVIEGSFTADEAKDLAIALNSGSLPVQVKEEYAAIVGASIGQEAVSKGVYASVIGLILVVVAVIAWYRFVGVIAVLSLAFNGLLVLAAFAYFDITLTLPGIAGLVLTIGMAVDSNVLIYERIREEQLLGKSLANCVQSGFQNAASAILDSNVTTLIAAGVLLQFGTGAIKGFAIALAIGVVSTLIAALVFTRALVEFVSDRQMVAKFKMTELIPLEPRINFMGRRTACVVGSLIAIAASVAIFSLRGQDNFGVDFRTGTNARIAITNDTAITDGAVRDAMVAAGFAAPTVQHYEGGDVATPNTFIIRVGQVETMEGTDGAVSTRIQQALLPLSTNPSSATLDDQVILESVQSVGPAVGAQLRLDAVNTMLYALLFIILYLWFRFEWKFSLGAVVAVSHDVVIVVGLMAVLGQQISIPVIAALLTIIGYSLNDKIVVFDRVREDIALNRSRGLSFVEGINISINRTLSRTLLTSPTMLMVLFVLYLFGGDELRPFSLSMILGIIVGTYSSIFIATAVVIGWQNFVDKRRAQRVDSGKATRRRKGPPGDKSERASVPAS